MNLDRLLQAIDHLLHHVRDRVRRADAHRVGDRQRVHVAFGGHLFDDVEEAIELGTGRVNREEDGVETGGLGGKRGLDRRFHRALDRPAVAVLDHVVAGRDLDDDPRAAAGLDDVDLGRDAAGEAEDLGLQAERGDVRDGRLVRRRHRGHAGLDAVDAQRVELLRDRDLLFTAEDDGGLLFAVTQRDIVNLEVAAKALLLPDFRQVRPRAAEPFVCFPGLLHLFNSQMTDPTSNPAKLPRMWSCSQCSGSWESGVAGDVTICVGPKSTMPSIRFTLNGKDTTAAYEPGMHLLEVLREECGIVSAKNGCAPEGACGCCLVMIDGTPASPA